MAACAVPTCKNNQKNCDKTFFTLPKTKKVAEAWIERLNRKDAIPKVVVVCDEHFEDTCFDKSTELRRRLQEPGKSAIFRILI